MHSGALLQSIDIIDNFKGMISFKLYLFGLVYNDTSLPSSDDGHSSLIHLLEEFVFYNIRNPGIVLCMCVCTYVAMCLSAYVGTYMQVCTYICIYVCMCICICMFVYKRVYICTYICIYYIQTYNLM